MTSALFYDRLQFAVTATFHYLFPRACQVFCVTDCG